MKIIDAHMHFSKIYSFLECSLNDSGLDYSEAGYKKEAKECGIVSSVCMGLYERRIGGFPDNDAETPMMADLSGGLPSEIVLCLGVNPHTLTGAAISKMEDIVVGGAKIAGIKIYAGYYHFDVSDPVYAPAYDFAERHNLTVVIHSGDTYSDRGKLIYSQPLSVDSLAVDRPDMRIVICHMGAPWLYDACEVAGKNPNVYMDLSGLYVGDKQYFEAAVQKPLLLDRYRQALVVMDKYDKILFGTDWPLVPMASYVNFCKRLVPPETYEMVFYENAVKVFNL